jgi:dipeptidyl aminopeptidase/acylaminoacyl peptidase
MTRRWSGLAWRRGMPLVLLGTLATLAGLRATAAPGMTLESLSGRIAYTRGQDNQWDVFLSAASGESEDRLTRTGAIEFDPRWSRDGRELLFHTIDNGKTVIWRVPFTGGTPTPVVDGTGGDYWAGSPSWAPNGRCIAFSGGHPSGDGRTDLQVRCDDGAIRTLVASDARNESGSDWSPDGARVAFEAEPIAGDRTATGCWGIRVVSADGTGEQILVDAAHISERHPRWSPDGTHLAFVTYPNRSGLGAGTLTVLDTPGGLTTEVAHGVAGPPAWSPDGRALVVAAISDAGPQGAGDFQVIGPVEAGDQKGLYIADLEARTIQRLRGPAGGANARPGLYEWGYGPDWTAGTATATPTITPTLPPSTTPTVTSSPTAPATPTVTATATPDRRSACFPLAMRNFAFAAADPTGVAPSR